MVDSIRIYNPAQKPFGELSIINLDRLSIDGTIYPTITNFVLSRNLITPIFRQTIENYPIRLKNINLDAKLDELIKQTTLKMNRDLNEEEIEQLIPKVLLDNANIFTLYNNYLTQEYVSTIRNALEKAYQSKLKNNDELVNILVSTNLRPIQYISNNVILGVGEDGNGMNLVGKILLQIRKFLTKQKVKEEKIQEMRFKTLSILGVYAARNFILEKIKENQDIKPYINLPYYSILEKTDQYLSLDNPPKIKDMIYNYNEIQHKQLIDKILDSEKDKDYVIELYMSGKLPEIESELHHPGTLTVFLYKKAIPYKKQELERIRKELIFKTYVSYTFKKKYENATEEGLNKLYDKFIIGAPNHIELLNLQNRILYLYELGQFSARLTELIDEKLKDLPKIDEFEDLKVPEEEVLEEQNKSSSSSSASSTEDELASIFKENTNKKSLIKILTNLSGKPKQYYNEWDVEKIKKRIEKYKRRATSDEEIKEEIKEERKTSGINWSTDVAYIQDEIKYDKAFLDTAQAPVQIYSDTLQNSEFYQFSPHANEPITINQIIFPNINLYIIAMLLTTLNVSSTYSTRGMSLEKAVKLLYVNEEDSSKGFVTINEAMEIYHTLQKETFEKMFQKNLTKANLVKFSNIYYNDLLLLTGYSKILYMEPNSLLLGAGSEMTPGKNIVGKVLMRIRKNLRKNKTFQMFEIKMDNLYYFIENDKFINNWIKMRLEDFCNNILRINNYLNATRKMYIKDPSSEEIDKKFVVDTVNIFLYPCKYFYTRKDHNPPEYFVSMLKMMKGFGFVPTQNYDKLLNEQDAILRNIKYFNEEEVVSKPVKVNSHLQRMNKIDFEYKNDPEYEKINRKAEKKLTKLKNSYNERGYENIEYIQKELPKQPQYLGIRKRDKGNRTVEYDEWINNLKTIYEDAEQVVNEFRDQKIKIMTKKRTKLTELYETIKQRVNKEFDENENVGTKVDNLRKEFQAKLYDTLKFEAPVEQTVKLEKIRKKYENLINKAGGRQDKKKIIYSKEELENKKNEQNKILLYMKEIKRQFIAERNHYNIKINEIAKVLWNCLISMLISLVSSLQSNKIKLTSENFKKAIIISQTMSSKEKGCVVVIKDEETNCIASALFNILKSIEKFKEMYAEEIQPWDHDIDLAVSMILNSPVTLKNQKVIISKEAEYIEMDEKHRDDGELAIVDDLEIKGEESEMLTKPTSKDDDDFEINIQDFNIFQDEEAEQDEEGEQDYGDDEEERDNDFEAEFGFNEKKYTNRMQTPLQTLYGDKLNSNDLAGLTKYFMKQVEYIKNYDLPSFVKNNRINFFATQE